MKKIFTASLLALFAPMFAFAQTLNTTYFASIMGFIQSLVSWVFPLAITIGLLVFFWELIQYIRASAEEKSKTRTGLLYSILALFIMISIVGILRLLQTVTGTQGVNVIDKNSIPTVQF
jgi:ABC-type long-subunit fatty acid transport system fused permease/ATPase subunit